MQGVRIEYTEQGEKKLSGLIKLKDSIKQLKAYLAQYPDARIVDRGEQY